MKIILKYLFRNIFEKKMRSLLITFSILLSTFLILLNFGVRDFFVQSYTDYTRSTVGETDIIILPNEESDQPFFEREQIKTEGIEVENSLEMFTGMGKLRDDENSLVKVKLIGLIPKEAESMGLMKLVEEDPSPFTGEKVILSEKMAEIWNVNIGDTIHLTANDTDQEVKIHAIAQKNGAFMGDQEQMVSFILPMETVRNYYGVKEQINSLYVDVTSDVSVTQVIEELEQQNAGLAITPAIDKESMEIQMTTITIALLFVMIIVLCISSYIIASLFKVIISERMPVIGTFQSVGATKLQTTSLLLLESGLYGVIGGALGLVIGYFSLPFIFQLLNQFEVENINRLVEYNPSHFIFSFIFAVAISMISSSISILKTNRLATKEVILNTVQTSIKLSNVKWVMGIITIAAAITLYLINTSYQTILGLLSIILLIIGVILLIPYITILFSKASRKLIKWIFGNEAELGIKNLQTNKLLHNNITLTTVALTFIIVIYTVIIGVQSYMVNISDSNDFDISISQLEKDNSKYDGLGEIAGVNEVYQEYLAFGDMEANQNRISSLTFIGLDKDHTFGEFHQDGVKFNLEEAEKLEEGRNIILDQFLANSHGLAIGDTIEIKVENSLEENLDYTIVGIMDASNFVTTRKAAMISLDNFQKEISEQPFQILLKTSGDRDEVKAAVDDELADTTSNVQTLDQIIQGSTQGVDGLFMILNIFILLALVLSVFGMMNNLIVSFIQRNRELAVLYSVCMSRNQIRKMFLFETIGSFLVSGIVACLVSYFISFMLPKFLWGAGIAFEFTYPFEFVGILILITLIVFSITTLVPSIKLTSMKIIDQLKMD